MTQDVETGQYQFTNNWFGVTAEAAWSALFPRHYRPHRVLEIGSYEGRAACWLAERYADEQWKPGLQSIHCVDTWKGSPEHSRDDMRAVRERFLFNVKLAMRNTDVRIIDCIWDSQSFLRATPMAFDLIYIDGSHAAPDVLADAVMAWPRLRVGGLMIFDDYLWTAEPAGSQDILNAPKLAIDAFVNCYSRKLKVLSLPSTQVYIEKVSD